MFAWLEGGILTIVSVFGWSWVSFFNEGKVQSAAHLFSTFRITMFWSVSSVFFSLSQKNGLFPPMKKCAYCTFISLIHFSYCSSQSYKYTHWVQFAERLAGPKKTDMNLVCECNSILKQWKSCVWLRSDKWKRIRFSKEKYSDFFYISNWGWGRSNENEAFWLQNSQTSHGSLPILVLYL